MPIIFSQDNVAFHVGREALLLSSYLSMLNNISDGAINLGKLCFSSEDLAFVFDYIRVHKQHLSDKDFMNPTINLFVSVESRIIISFEDKRLLQRHHLLEGTQNEIVRKALEFAEVVAFLKIRPALFLLAKVISKHLHENRSFEKWCTLFGCEHANKKIQTEIKKNIFSEYLIASVKQQMYQKLNSEIVFESVTQNNSEVEEVRFSDEYYYFYF